jgi:hypothetical protein
VGQYRFTLAALMGAVALVAVGVAALRSPTALWASLVIVLVLGAICGATVGAILMTAGKPVRVVGYRLRVGPAARGPLWRPSAGALR